MIKIKVAKIYFYRKVVRWWWYAIINGYTIEEVRDEIYYLNTFWLYLYRPLYELIVRDYWYIFKKNIPSLKDPGISRDSRRFPGLE